MIDPAIIDLMHHMARTPAAIERPAGPAWTAADVDSGEVTVQGIERELEEWAEAANSQVVRLADALRRAGASPERLHRLDQMIEAFEGTVGQDAVSYRRIAKRTLAAAKQAKAISPAVGAAVAAQRLRILKATAAYGTARHEAILALRVLRSDLRGASQGGPVFSDPDALASYLRAAVA